MFKMQPNIIIIFNDMEKKDPSKGTEELSGSS